MLTLPGAVMKSFILFLFVGELLAMPLMTSSEIPNGAKKTVVIRGAENVACNTFAENENKEKDPPEYFCFTFSSQYKRSAQIGCNLNLLLNHPPLANSLFAIYRVLLI